VAPPAIRGEACVLLDFASGQVLCFLDPHRRLYPASLTKMMTAILAAERCRPDEWVTVSAEAAAVGETSLNLQAGQQVTVRDLLTGAVVKSANDAAAALACHISGSQANFAALMNTRAQELGLRGTHFVNPHGLHDPRHYTTAADLATLARAFMTHPLLREIARLPEADLPSLQPTQSRHVWNQNRLIRRWEECTGIKGGYTKQAGNCLAAAARRGGWDLICVVLKSGEVWDDAQRLLEWGFANYRRVLPAAVLGGGVSGARLGRRAGICGGRPGRHRGLRPPPRGCGRLAGTTPPPGATRPGNRGPGGGQRPGALARSAGAPPALGGARPSAGAGARGYPGAGAVGGPPVVGSGAALWNG